MATPREHIESIRKNTFKIGQEPGAKDVMLHHVISYLSAELYTKDVHFLMELIQNAEDNDYSEGVDPSLEFVITSQDITATEAPATLLIFNNEIEFSPKNIVYLLLGLLNQKRQSQTGIHWRKRNRIQECLLDHISTLCIQQRLPNTIQ